jgi:hypothetical protein
VLVVRRSGETLLWSKEDVVVVDVELDRNGLLHLDHSGPRLQAEARPDKADGRFATSLSSGLDGDKYD